jgi:anti-sigma-K factor RskA
MIDEQLEFLIAQYADGTLPDSERALVELRLQTDADARAMLDEYRTLDATLKTSMPLPAVNWERLADHLSEAVAEQRETRAATVLGRIGNFGRLAIAAALVMAVAGVAIWSTRGPGDTGGTTTVVTTDVTPIATPIVVVRGPAPEVSAAQPVVVVSVGPSSDVSPNWRAGEGVVTGPSRVVWIASSGETVQDTQRLPY